MAGTRLELVTDTATPAVQYAASALSGEGVTLMLSGIGEYLVRATRERADAEVSPDGTPWAALSPRYKKHKDKKRPGVPKLRFDFHMMGDRFTHQVVGNELYVGTNAKYGAAHQFGYEPGGIPARRWLGLSDADEEEVLAIAQDHLRGLFDPRSSA